LEKKSEDPQARPKKRKKKPATENKDETASDKKKGSKRHHKNKDGEETRTNEAEQGPSTEPKAEKPKKVKDGHKDKKGAKSKHKDKEEPSDGVPKKSGSKRGSTEKTEKDVEGGKKEKDSTTANETLPQQKENGSSKATPESKTAQPPLVPAKSGPLTKERKGKELAEIPTPKEEPPKKPTAEGGVLFTVRAIEAYKSKQKTDLSFAKGATIQVLEENTQAGTYRGAIGKKTGWYQFSLLFPHQLQRLLKFIVHHKQVPDMVCRQELSLFLLCRWP